MNRSINSLLDVIGSITDYEKYSKDFTKEIASKVGHPPSTGEAIDYLLDDLISSIDADFGPIEQIATTAYELGKAEAGISDVNALSYGKKEEMTGPLRTTFVMEYLRGRQDGLVSGRVVANSNTTWASRIGDIWVIAAGVMVLAGCLIACVKLSW